MENQRSDDWDEDEQQQDEQRQDQQNQDQQKQDQQQQDGQQQQQTREDSAEKPEQSSRSDEIIGDDDDFDRNFQQPEKQHEDAPPGTDCTFNDEPTNDSTPNQIDESYDHHDQNESIADQSGVEGGSNDNTAGNTTPLCDEDESKE